MNYLNYTQEDATNDGIGYKVSQFSTKAVDCDNMIGAFLFEDAPLRFDKYFLQGLIDKEEKNYFENLNHAYSVLLRKVIFRKDYLYTGELENLFDYITAKIIPTTFIIWCNNVDPVKEYITQLGGFNPPIYQFPNKNIVLFSIDS